MKKKYKILASIVGITLAGGAVVTELPKDKPQTIEEKIAGKDFANMKRIKGEELSKSSLRNIHQDGLIIDIQAIEPIIDGIQVFVKARTDNNGALLKRSCDVLDSNNQPVLLVNGHKKQEPCEIYVAPNTQIGFGYDGSVEVERFRYINPPIKVPDGTKRSITNATTGETIEVDNFKEDVNGAIKILLLDSVKATGKVTEVDGNTIQLGKVGNTTDTFFPVAGANSPVDGLLNQSSVDKTWTNIRTGLASTTDVTATVDYVPFVRASSTSNQWSQFVFGVFTFDTSSIGGDTISSCTLSLYGTTPLTTIPISSALIATTPAATNALAKSDYTNRGNTLMSDTSIAVASWSAVGYNDYACNAAGISNINKTGVSKFGHTAYEDVTDVAPTWTSLAFSGFQAYFADQAGTTNDPKLVVVHSFVDTSNLEEYWSIIN